MPFSSCGSYEQVQEAPEAAAPAVRLLTLAGISPDLARRAVQDELYRRGDLSFLIDPVTRSGQRAAYDFVKSVHAASPNSISPIVLNCRRGMGKTFLLAILAVETCLKKRSFVLFVGPSLTQALGVLAEAMHFVLSNCPPDCMPEIKRGGEVYEFANGSRFRVAGAREGAEHLRGLRADVVLLDEVALFDDLPFILRDVVAPLFAGRDNPLYIITTTPPASTGHPFVADIVPRAVSLGRYRRITAAEDSAFTPQEREKFLSVFGTDQSVAWRREFGCELLADPDALAVPSFEFNKSRIVVPHPRPFAYFSFIAADLGFVDCTGVVFGYVDFGEQRLIVEDEVCAASLGTAALVSILKTKEAAVFGKPLHEPVRVADATARELDDLRQAGCHFQSAKSGAEKWDKFRGLAYLETLCAQDKIRIHPRCTNLRYQLENAVKNDAKTDLKRVKRETRLSPLDPQLGHYDALWALVYGAWKMRLRWLDNPFPRFDARDQSVYRNPLATQGAPDDFGGDLGIKDVGIF